MKWVEKNHCCTKNVFDSELIITKSSTGTKNHTMKVVFRFMKNSFWKICREQMYILVAKEGTRYYFKESTPNRGWKLSGYSDTSKLFRVDEELLPFDDKDLGEYNLEYDSEVGLHFIDTKRRLVKNVDWVGRR